MTQKKGSRVAEKVQKSEAEWKKILTSEQYRVSRLKGTETAFTGEYWNHTGEGLYRCVCCDSPLFPSDTKFNSSCGWPSFSAPSESGTVIEEEDRSYFMNRTEVVCGACDAHLGHMFPDGPPPSGIRYCINSASLRFESTSSRPPEG